MKRTTSALQHLTMFAVSTVFILSALFGMYKCLSQPPEIPEEDPAPAVKEDGLPITIEENGSEERKDSFYTILVGGLDNKNGGSDTNLLIAVDAKNGNINVVSLPRDTLLNVSWSVKKLNNAYHHGGFERTRAEVSKLLGIPIDFYVTVDLGAFVQLVDAIGGVDFEKPVLLGYTGLTDVYLKKYIK